MRSLFAKTKRCVAGISIAKQNMLCIAILLASVTSALAADWPMWKHNANRMIITDETLPAKLELQWKRDLGTPVPAWPLSQKKLLFDLSYEPVVSGKIIFVPSMNEDKVTAYNTDSGKELWRFYTEGPVRFAPVVYKEKLFVSSDDGYLYSINASSGKLINKTLLAPKKKKLIGNKRMVSMWPARGGMALFDGKLYVAAGLWPFMGTFIYSIDAETEKVIWCNSGTGSLFTKQPHKAAAFGGVAPHGYITVTKDILLVAGGRSAPAAHDTKTGKLLYFHHASKIGGKGGGAYGIAVSGKYMLYNNNDVLCSLAKGGQVMGGGKIDFFIEDTFYGIDEEGCLAASTLKSESHIDRKGKKRNGFELNPTWKHKVSTKAQDIMLQAGNMLFCSSSDGELSAFDYAKKPSGNEMWKASWTAKVEGTPWSMLAADKKIFLVTTEGTLYCFGDKQSDTAYKMAVKTLQPSSPEVVKTVDSILSKAKAKDGYCLVYGIGDGELIQELTKKTNFQVIVLKNEKDDLIKFQRKMDDAGLYGHRITAFAGKIADLPPYFANLAIIQKGSPEDKSFNDELMRILRPFGGKAISLSTNKMIEKKGALPGSASWSHQYADAANTLVSQDELVKLPLGLLWFGGPSNDKILPRHGHGPSPQVTNGRLYIEGQNILRAVDVYTGRVHWEREFPNIGRCYKSTAHRPGANSIGSNYVCTDDAVYLIAPEHCMKLSPETGETVDTFKLPDSQKWGFIATKGDYLAAASTPVDIKGLGWRGDSVMIDDTLYEPVIKTESEWSYLAGSEPKSDWATTAKLPASWKLGEAGFGYSKDKGMVRTLLKDMKGKYISLCMRQAFDYPEKALPKTMLLKLRYAGGALVYLNGKEVARINLSDSNAAGKGASISMFENILIKTEGIIKKKDNILAIQGFNKDISGKMFIMDPYLVYKITEPLAKKPEVLFENNPDVQVNANYAMGSQYLNILDRQTGKVLWTRKAAYTFRHNAIIMTKDTVYCIDSLSEPQLAIIRRRGYNNYAVPTVYALDIKTGKVLWESPKAFGTWLSYSEKHNIVLQANGGGVGSRDRAMDEARSGMSAHNASTGKTLWKHETPYGGPCMLHEDKIIAQKTAFDILTGKTIGMPDPLNKTKTMPWTMSRSHGCNTIIASKTMLLFRSGAATFFDLSTMTGMGSFAGFKSGCTSNLIAADGVLNAPDYTRTCGCSYQLQSSLALVHMPELEYWTYTALKEATDVKRVGLNFGAPGDRVSGTGTLWLDYPVVGGSSPKLALSLNPKKPETYRKHSSLIKSEGLRWVASSGLLGIDSISLDFMQNSTCDINLYFSEPTFTQPGERIFTVMINGKPVLENLDIISKTQKKDSVFIHKLTDVKVGDKFEISFKASKGKTLISGIEIIKK